VLALMFVAGCDAANGPVAPPESDPVVPTDETAAVEDPDVVAPPRVPELGTAADALEASVVWLEPGDPGSATTDDAVRVDVRVADERDARGRGLMGVEDLPAGAGMLFVYPEERAGGFWMKDTLVALDIAFIAADGTVKAVLTMEPCTAEPCPVYDPEVDYLAALEVPAGFLAAKDIRVGSRARWQEPVPAGVAQ
jgi:uncharacterized membrane protein (UPF0127 family)